MFISGFRFLFGPFRSPADSSAGGGTGTPSAPTTTTTGTSTPTTIPTGSSGASPTSSTTDGTQTTATQPTGPDTDIQDGNWKQLRTKYDERGQKITEYEPQAQAYTKIHTAASTLATQLGYTAEDFKFAFDSDPIGTLTLLQHEAKEAAGSARTTTDDGQPDLTKQLEDMVDQRMKPVTEHVNQQQTEVAMQRYSTELTQAISSNNLVATAPPEVQDMVKDYLEEYFAGQPNILTAMKQKGDFSAVKDAVSFVAGRLHSAFTKWQAAEMGRTGGRPAANTQGAKPNGKFTLDQIIDDPGVLGDQYR